MQLRDLNITIPMYTNIMIKGNQLYDSFNLPVHLGQNVKHLKKLEIISDLGFVTVRDL